MSRLDSVIRRLQAQRACLDWACAEIKALDGPVLELGLGNGRTYDHLRTCLPSRRIIAFDRALACHPDCRPPPQDYIEGEINSGLQGLAQDWRGKVALAHLDLGGGDAAATERNMAGVMPALVPLLQQGGLILSDQPVGPGEADLPLAPLPLPDGIQPGRYHIARKI